MWLYWASYIWLIYTQKMKNSVVAAHCQYLKELVSGRNLSKLPSGYKVSHAFNPGECSASTALLNQDSITWLVSNFRLKAPFSFPTCPSNCDLTSSAYSNHKWKNMGNKNLGICIFSLQKTLRNYFSSSICSHITNMMCFDLIFLIFLRTWLH